MRKIFLIGTILVAATMGGCGEKQTVIEENEIPVLVTSPYAPNGLYDPNNEEELNVVLRNELKADIENSSYPEMVESVEIEIVGGIVTYKVKIKDLKEIFKHEGKKELAISFAAIKLKTIAERGSTETFNIEMIDSKDVEFRKTVNSRDLENS